VGYAWQLSAAGGHHWQCFLQLAKPHTFAYVQKRIQAEAHIEFMMGSAEQARDYLIGHDHAVATNQRLMHEEGEFRNDPAPAQGARTDLVKAVKDIQEGKNIFDMITESPGLMRVWNHLTRYEALHRGRTKSTTMEMPTRTIKIIWGETGARKSSMAWDAYVKEDGGVFVKSEDSPQWWAGYSGQHTVIWNEFDPRKCSIDTLKRLMDPWPHMVPVKNGETPWLCQLLILTANSDPAGWYADCSVEDRLALQRRIESVEFVTAPAGVSVSAWGLWPLVPQAPPL